MQPSDNDLDSFFTFETDSSPLPDELPFHLLILGDWSGNINRSPLDMRIPIEIDRDNFDDVMQKLNVGIEIDFSSEGSDRIELRFSELDDFHPDNLFNKLSVFSHFYELRRRLLNPETYESAVYELKNFNTSSSVDRQVFEENTVPNDNLLDSILSQSEHNQVTENDVRHKSELDQFISKIISPFLVTVDESEQLNYLAAIDESISDLMRQILHNPDFQSIESAWRGLFFLVRRIETRNNLKIFILDVSKDEITSNLKSVNNLEESLLFRQIVRNRSDADNSTPFSLIAGNYDFSVDIDNIATLIRLGKIAHSSFAPFVSYLDSQELFVNKIEHFNKTLDHESNHLSVSYKLWNTLRSIPEADFIGLSPNKFLGRLPFGRKTVPTENLSFEEFNGDFSASKLLWISPCFIFAFLYAQHFSLHEWNIGQNLLNEVDKLPLYIRNLDESSNQQFCSSVFQSENDIESLLDLGLVPLLSFRNSDSIKIPRFQSIAFPARSLSSRLKS